MSPNAEPETSAQVLVKPTQHRAESSNKLLRYAVITGRWGAAMASVGVAALALVAHPDGAWLWHSIDLDDVTIGIEQEAAGNRRSRCDN